MAIRFDKDTRRATNGPVIFFSDASSQNAFAEEIESAYLTGLNFYSYRLPGDLMISFGSSEKIIEGIGEPGFVIGMFNPEIPFLTIPYKATSRMSVGETLYNYPEHSTGSEDYRREVEGIVSDIDNIPGRKVVACRVEIRNRPLDLAATFFDFCRKFPETMVFCFSSKVTGCWIGASPELLLKCHGGNLETMSLAGTRKAAGREVWDKKNDEEQLIVTEYIVKILQKHGLTPEIGERFTKITGEIEHLCTPISALKTQNLHLYDLLKDLSPTPALCGNPKEFALHEIKKYENFDRGCYGGFCGPFHSEEDFSLNVVLRCASYQENRYNVYVGGGITNRSEFSEEWKETNLKLRNMFGE